MDWDHTQGGVEILSVASCCTNQDKVWPDGPQLACMQTCNLHSCMRLFF